MKTPALHPKPYQGMVFRNIFTHASGAHIFADVCDEEDYEIVDAVVQITSAIDHHAPQFHRPFQYSHIEDEEIFAVFKKENWSYGRFGDGKTYGVWYGAEDELTSVYESSWVASQLAQDNVLPHHEVYTTDRAMYSAQIKSELAPDMTQEKSIFPQLVHPTDYSFCQAMGKEMAHHQQELLRTPSARRTSGICTPLFSPKPIQDCQRIYYLKIHIHPDGLVGINSSQGKMNFSMEVTSLKDPYLLLIK